MSSEQLPVGPDRTTTCDPQAPIHDPSTTTNDDDEKNEFRRIRYEEIKNRYLDKSGSFYTRELLEKAVRYFDELEPIVWSSQRADSKHVSLSSTCFSHVGKEVASRFNVPGIHPKYTLRGARMRFASVQGLLRMNADEDVIVPVTPLLLYYSCTVRELGLPRDADLLLQAPAKEAFDKWAKVWTTSDECKALANHLRQNVKIPGTINKMVGFALGSISTPLNDEDGVLDSRQVNTRVQHQLLRTLRDVLTEKGHEIEVFAQDPEYTDTDNAVLGELGIQTIKHHGAGFLKVDRATVVVSISPDIPVKQIICDFERPAIIIWEDGRRDMEGFLDDNNERETGDWKDWTESNTETCEYAMW